MIDNQTTGISGVQMGETELREEIEKAVACTRFLDTDTGMTVQLRKDIESTARAFAISELERLHESHLPDEDYIPVNAIDQAVSRLREGLRDNFGYQVSEASQRFNEELHGLREGGGKE